MSRPASRSAPSCRRSVDNGTRVHFPESAVDPRVHGRRRPTGGRRGRSATSMSRSRSCTGRSARTAPSRACSSCSGCRTSATACSRRRSAWTSTSRRSVLQAAGVAVAPWVTVSRAQLAARARAVGPPHPGARSAGVREAGARRIEGRREQGARLGRARCRARHRVRRGRHGARRAGIAGARSSAPCCRGATSGPTRVSVAGEIVFTGREFYDFDAKYRDAPGIELVCPADLTAGELAEMQRIAARAFDAIGGRGLARVDFFSPASEFIVNEINTMPGFTPISMFPSLLAGERAELPRPDHRADRAGPRDRRASSPPLIAHRSPSSSVSVHSSPFSRRERHRVLEIRRAPRPGPDAMSRSTTTSTAGSRPKLVNSQYASSAVVAQPEHALVDARQLGRGRHLDAAGAARPRRGRPTRRWPGRRSARCREPADRRRAAARSRPRSPGCSRRRPASARRSASSPARSAASTAIATQGGGGAGGRLSSLSG